MNIYGTILMSSVCAVLCSESGFEYLWYSVLVFGQSFQIHEAMKPFPPAKNWTTSIVHFPLKLATLSRSV